MIIHIVSNICKLNLYHQYKMKSFCNKIMVKKKGGDKHNFGRLSHTLLKVGGDSYTSASEKPLGQI